MGLPARIDDVRQAVRIDVQQVDVRVVQIDEGCPIEQPRGRVGRVRPGIAEPRGREAGGSVAANLGDRCQQGKWLPRGGVGVAQLVRSHRLPVDDHRYLRAAVRGFQLES